MSEKLAFELVSPAELVVSEEVDMVVFPGRVGDMGVLPGHAPVISVLRPGTICMFEGKTVSKRLFVAGGFAEVTGARCTVLAEDAVSLEDVSAEDVEQEVGDYRDDGAAATEEAEKVEAEKKLEVALAKLDAITNPPY